jgi:hypothetical protein
MIWLKPPAEFLAAYARAIASSSSPWTARLVALARVVHGLCQYRDTQTDTTTTTGLSLRTVRQRWAEAAELVAAGPARLAGERHGSEFWMWVRSMLEDPNVRPLARLVGLMVGTICRFGGTGFRSHAWVAQSAGVSLRAAGEALRELETQGWLRVTRRRGPSLYRLAWPASWSAGPAAGSSCRQDLDLSSSGSQIRSLSEIRSHNLKARRARVVALAANGDFMADRLDDPEDDFPTVTTNGPPRLALVPPPARPSPASAPTLTDPGSPPPAQNARPGRVGDLDTDRAPAPSTEPSPPAEPTAADRAYAWLRDPTIARLSDPNPEAWPEVRAVLEAEARAFRMPWAIRPARPGRRTWNGDTKIVRILEALADGYTPEELEWAFEGAKAEDWIRKNPRFLNAADILAKLERVPALIASGVQLEIARHRARLAELKAGEGRRYLEPGRNERDAADRDRLTARVAELEALLGGPVVP